MAGQRPGEKAKSEIRIDAVSGMGKGELGVHLGVAHGRGENKWGGVGANRLVTQDWRINGSYHWIVSYP